MTYAFLAGDSAGLQTWHGINLKANSELRVCEPALLQRSDSEHIGRHLLRSVLRLTCKGRTECRR